MSEEEEEPKLTTTTTEKEETSKSDDEQDKEKENNEDGGEKPLKETNSMIVLNGAQEGSKVYVVGTAHFSEESQKEVAELIRRVRPSRVVIELCNSRINILKDEETVLREAKDMTVQKMIQMMKQTSVVHGFLQSLLIRIYAKVTEELGMAPGGEFRVAYREAMQVPGCRVILGDMPVALTLRRGFGSLPWYRKLKLAWSLLDSDFKITKEDIEEMKKSDMLEALVKELGTEFPEFKRVLIDERDLYLTHSLKQADNHLNLQQNNNAEQNFNNFKNNNNKNNNDENNESQSEVSCVVGVVGIGHMSGIKKNWDIDFNIDHLLKQDDEPKPRNPAHEKYATYAKYSMFLGTAAIIGLQLYSRRR